MLFELPFYGKLVPLVFYELSISLSIGSDTCLYNHTGDIIHAFVHGGRGIQTPTEAATSPFIVMYGVSSNCATEIFPEKEAHIAQIKTSAITVPSV